MERSPFEFAEYKSFVLSRIEAYPQGGRGVRARIAEAMGCQVAYVSHVLAADRHFSPEQAEALARFFALRVDEAEYFVLLVERARAGTPQLRQMIERQLERRREEYGELRARVQLRGRITPADQATYYSSWHYQAIRMLLTVPGHGTVARISERLGIPAERVTEVLTFLLEKGWVSETAQGYAATDVQVHLGGDSPLISKLHANWRIHSLTQLDRRNPEDLRYSGVVALSHGDFARVRELWVKTLLRSHKVVGPSREERVCAMALDFYEL
jgi:uncharacterized protein (TIGR02147 family)